MKKKSVLSKVLILVFIVVFGIICGMTGSAFDPVGTLWSLFPPVVAIGLALITKEVYSSLFVGIIVGGLLAANFNPVTTVDSIVNDGLIAAVAGSAGIFIFLVLLGVLVALINKSGAAEALGQWASAHVKTKVGASICTFVLGVLIFIDDYFNCLTVGAVMRPVTDKAKISRAKLAYLIDATAAPVCMIAPISSWAAAVAGYAPEGQGISLFVKAIPFNFYSILTFVFILAITFMKFDYGSMRLFEANAEKGDLFTVGGPKGETEDTPGTGKARVIDLVLPIVILIGVCIYALVYIGRVLTGEGPVDFITAFSNTDATVGLPWGGLVALLIAIIYFIARRLVTFQEAMECIPKGFKAMVPAILILTMATALKNLTGLLDSSTFVNNALANASGLNMFLPAIIFVIACAIAFATGTSWGTFGILIPIVLGIFPIGDTMGVICMSACLAGAVCGDHCSPISDTTIMSSAGAQCDHVSHVSTQLPYALTVAVISFIGYLLTGLIQNALIVLAICSVIMIVFLFVMRAAQRKQN